jgi:TadE-like protein
MICHSVYDLSSRATGVPSRPHLPDGVGERGICSLPKIKQIACRLGNADGAEIAEAALVLPLLFMLLLGIVWFGRAFNIYSTITQAAQQGAITAARASCATCTPSNSFPNDTAVDNAIYAVMQASSLDPTQIPANPNPPNPMSCVNPPITPCTTAANNITICRQVLLNPAVGIQPAQCGTIVSFQYPFQFDLPFTSLNMQKIILSAQAQSRMEN